MDAAEQRSRFRFIVSMHATVALLARMQRDGADVFSAAVDASNINHDNAKSVKPHRSDGVGAPTITPIALIDSFPPDRAHRPN